MVLTELSTGALVSNVFGVQWGPPDLWAGAIEIRPSTEWLGSYGLWNTFPLDIVDRNQSSKYPATSRFSLLPSTSRYSNVLISDKACPSDGTRTSCEDLAGGLFTPDFQESDNSTVFATSNNILNFTNVVQVSNGRHNTNFTQFYQLLNSVQSGPGWMGLSPESETVIAPDAELTANTSVARTREDARYNRSSVYSILGSRYDKGYTSRNTPAVRRLDGYMSWGYTAGIYASKIPGSLVYGGIDSNRFDLATSHRFQMSRNARQRFPISIIELNINMINDTGHLMPQKIITNTVGTKIDSEVEFLVLPPDPVHTIATILGAKAQRNGSDIYLIDAVQHEYLTKRNTTIPLQLGRHDDSGNLMDSMQVDLDYNTLVFPAKPTGTNSTQSDGQQVLAITTAAPNSTWYLGRAFLQSVYMIADYEKSTFNLSVAISTASGSKIEAMSDVWYREGILSKPQGAVWIEHELSTDPKAIGATIGATVAVSIILGLIYVWFRRRRRIRRRAGESEAGLTVESDDVKYVKSELPGHGLRRKESDSSTIYEAPQDDGPKELDAEKGGAGAAAELEVEMEVHELDAGSPIYVTLASPRP